MKVMYTLFAVVIMAVMSASYAGSGTAHWTYDGHAGPEHWGRLAKEFGTCEVGTQQSPVNIEQSITADLAQITFDYQSAPIKVVNNGHTIQVNYSGDSKITIGSKAYKLLQFHFHSPSENRIGGKPFDMEVHLVHKNDAGELAVIGVLMQAGTENSVLAPLWQAMPEEVNKERVLTAQINAADLLPERRQFYHFKGSLTTPPCTEGVDWFVMKDATSLSTSQVQKFVGMVGHNARPVQAANHRFILSTAN